MQLPKLLGNRFGCGPGVPKDKDILAFRSQYPESIIKGDGDTKEGC